MRDFGCLPTSWYLVATWGRHSGHRYVLVFHDFQLLYIRLIIRGNGWPSDNDGGKCIPHQIHSPLAAWRRGDRSVCSLQRGLPWREDLEPCQVEGASSSLSDSYLHLVLNNLRRRNCRAGMHCRRLPQQPDLHVDRWWTEGGGWRWKHFEIGTPWSRGWWLNCDMPGTFRPSGQSNSTILHYLIPLFTLIHIFGSCWLWQQIAGEKLCW